MCILIHRFVLCIIFALKGIGSPRYREYGRNELFEYEHTSFGFFAGKQGKTEFLNIPLPSYQVMSSFSHRRRQSWHRLNLFWWGKKGFELIWMECDDVECGL